jgi:hypothetical protein
LQNFWQISYPKRFVYDKETSQHVASPLVQEKNVFFYYYLEISKARYCVHESANFGPENLLQHLRGGGGGEEIYYSPSILPDRFKKETVTSNT